MSFLNRISVDMGNALLDAYGNLVHGDDAGKSAKLVFVARPRPSLLMSRAGNDVPVSAWYDLGCTFLEVNNRAYVRSVIPDSLTETAGVQPRDCVQFAAVLAGDLINLKDDEVKAVSYALDCEKRGIRTNFDELKEMFAGCCITDNTDGEEKKKPSVETLKGVTSACSPNFPDNKPSVSNFGAKYSVVIVFRRTRKRHHATLGGLVPIGIPSFRIDDECDRAAALVRRLAPTVDTTPDPDAWDEMVHDGTEWLLPNGSIMPPAYQTPSPIGAFITRPSAPLTEGQRSDAKMADLSSLGKHVDSGIKRVKSGDLTQDTIPPDSWEKTSSKKKNQVRSQMLAEAIHQGSLRKQDDIEASFIRGMIQKAVGLAFVRTSKVVLGVSLHIGSGIIIARLPDGTWSAPSAIGTFGGGVGFQFGLEVVEYIFIIKSEESLAQFRLGAHVTVGGNMGAAFAGMGREAYGAASVGGTLCSPRELDKYDFEVKPIIISPVIAYARSQGLYVGISLEGSRIFTRHDINNRTYKFATGKAVSAADILGGKVATPPEAEDLYASLHSAEFTHELSGIPRPPEILRKDSPNDWRFDRSTLTASKSERPFSFLSTITDKDAEECSTFETTFKKFLYGGVSVQRLVPNAESTGGKTRRERRTLWLMLPEVGALRLGFISKLHDGDNSVSKKSSFSKEQASPRARFRIQRKRSNISDSDDSVTEFSENTEDYTVTSEDDTKTFDDNTTELDNTINSTIKTEDESITVRSTRSRNVHLSNKHSVALTDVSLLSQEPNVSIRFSPDDATEHLRFIAVHDCKGTSLLFLANNFREAEILVCGLKLLIERETARLGVRGGISIAQLGRKSETNTYINGDSSMQYRSVNIRRDSSPVSSSENGESDNPSFYGEDISRYPPNRIPEGRSSWSRVPGRSYLRDQASKSQTEDDLSEIRKPTSQVTEHIPKYFYGQLIIREIAVNVKLPLPLPLCRVLLLDSSSPVISKWEIDRGDSNYSKSRWTFPPSTPRDLERHASEHKLIASGSMIGAHRVTSYQRMRNGTPVQLTETQIVDADDPDKVAFSVAERLPRRGFSVKIRILLKATQPKCCEATVLAEVRPMGKNMSNQLAVHRALLLVLDEIIMRYGTEGKGLLAGFLSVVNNLPDSNKPSLFETSVLLETSKQLPQQQTKQENIQTRAPVQQPGILIDSRSPSNGSSSSPYPSAHQPSSPSNSSPQSPPATNTEMKSSNPPIKSTEKQMNNSTSPQRQRTGNASKAAALASRRRMRYAQALRDSPENSNLKTKEASRKNQNFVSFEKKIPEKHRTITTTEEKKTVERRKRYTEKKSTDEKLEESKPMTIEVKPLPKIRLDLMPAPREEDEDEESSTTTPVLKMKRSTRMAKVKQRKSNARKNV